MRPPASVLGRPLSLGAAFASVALVSACGAGQYGYDREYVPLGDEDDYLEQATEVTYEEVRRNPADYRSAMVGWFGVVTALDADANGRARVALTYRTHQPRHLCRDETAGSCRVTVSDRAGGPFSAVIEMRPEDRAGQDRMWIGSLVKVYGLPSGDFDEQGGPVLQAQHYRHWPRGTYVTTGAASAMRR
jgi:hypothetical protein